MAVKRWTDEMLDEFASKVDDLRESASETRESVSDLRESVSETRKSVSDLRDSVSETRESVSDLRDSVDGLRITTQALLQIAAQQQQRMDRFEEEMDLMKQRQAESDERFNILLEEVRYLIRGNREE